MCLINFFGWTAVIFSSPMSGPIEINIKTQRFRFQPRNAINDLLSLIHEPITTSKIGSWNHCSSMVRFLLSNEEIMLLWINSIMKHVGMFHGIRLLVDECIDFLSKSINKRDIDHRSDDRLYVYWNNMNNMLFDGSISLQ